MCALSNVMEESITCNGGLIRIDYPDDDRSRGRGGDCACRLQLPGWTKARAGRTRLTAKPRGTLGNEGISKRIDFRWCWKKKCAAGACRDR